MTRYLTRTPGSAWATVVAVCVTAMMAWHPSQATEIPSVVAPGAIERGQTPKLSPPTDTPFSIIPTLDRPVPPQGADAVQFVLHGVLIEGAKALEVSAIEPAYVPLIGHSVSLADLYVVANRITKLYGDAGYALSFSVVPAQRVSDGVVHIQVVEGYIADVSLEGLPEGTSRVLESYARKLRASRPLKTADLERYLLLANDLSGYHVRATFERIAGAERGATRLVISIEHKPVSAEAKISNRGSRAFGPLLADGQASFSGYLFDADQLRLHILNAVPFNEMTYTSLAFQNPIDEDGLQLDSFVSYSRARPNLATLRSVDFSSEAWISHIGVEDALLRSRSSSLWISGGLTAKSFDGNVLRTANSRDRIYLLTAGLRYLERDDGGFTAINTDVNEGLKVLDATGAGAPLASRMTGSAAYTDLHVYAARQQRLGDTLELVLSGEGQFAGRALLSSEQCSYGGEVFGRGFDDSEIQGDSCLMGSAELRYAPPLPDWAKSNSVLLQIYAFADAGRTWKRGTLLSGEDRSDDAESIGGGVRVMFSAGLSGCVEFAQPIDRDVAQEGNRHGRVFASLNEDF